MLLALLVSCRSTEILNVEEVVVRKESSTWCNLAQKGHLADVFVLLQKELEEEYPGKILPRIYMTPAAAVIEVGPTERGSSHIVDVPLIVTVEYICRGVGGCSYMIKDNDIHIYVPQKHQDTAED